MHSTNWKAVALIVVLLQAGLCCFVGAQDANQFRVQGGNNPDGPRVLSKNTNEIKKLIEKQDIQEDEWQLTDMKVVKEETLQTVREEKAKHDQDDINSKRFAIQGDKLKETEDKIFQAELERTKEQSRKKGQEQDEKSSKSLAYEEKEDVKRFKLSLRNAKRKEQIWKRKLQIERQKLEFIAEQGDKKQREQKQKLEAEQAMKADAEKAKARAQEDMNKQETFLKKQQEARNKQDEQAKKSAEKHAEQFNKNLKAKDESHQKMINSRNEALQKEKEKIEEQKRKQAENEQKQKQRAAEERNKRCTPLQVWSAGWGNNIWQFKVKDNVYNKNTHGFRRGFNVLILKPRTYTLESLKFYDTHASSGASRQLAADLRGVPDGSVIAIACQDECARSRERTLNSAFSAIGFQKPQQIGYRHSYVGIVVKGQGNAKEVAPGNNALVTVDQRFNCD